MHVPVAWSVCCAILAAVAVAVMNTSNDQTHNENLCRISPFAFVSCAVILLLASALYMTWNQVQRAISWALDFVLSLAMFIFFVSLFVLLLNFWAHYVASEGHASSIYTQFEQDVLNFYSVISAVRALFWF